MTVETLHGDCLDVLPTLEPGSIQAVVTSPPYYALRDYGLPPSLWPPLSYTPIAGMPSVDVVGCDPHCDHLWGEPLRAPWANSQAGPNGRRKNPTASRSRGKLAGQQCERCGGWRGCLGLEPDPHLYVAHLVHVFRQLWPLLADDGSVWLNLGDSYASGGNGGGGKFMQMRAHKGWGFRADKKGWRSAPEGMKDKDLLGIPWRVALALQADGWYLRSEVIWNKPNGMPESAHDRPTRIHEHVFLLTKAERYYHDAAAIAEPAVSTRTDAAMSFRRDDSKRGTAVVPGSRPSHRPTRADVRYTGELRRRRTVWDIPIAQYRGAHYAVMPEELAEVCILASSKPGDMVLDPFGGTGTVGRVADRLGRSATLIELSHEYLGLQEQRLNGVQREMTDLTRGAA